MILAVVLAYVAIVLAIGLFSQRFFRGTSEDFFVAGRTLGPLILLISLFGANMTAFALLGSAGEAYRSGVGVFALMASSSALVIPAVFFFIGTRVWALGKRRGYLTPAQLFRERWGSDGLGLLLFLVQVGMLVPYLLIGVKGGGATLAQMTGGRLPEWAGGALICAVVLTYVTYGGIRGTIWVNVFQTLLLLALGLLAFGVVVGKLGGLGPALARVAASHPGLLVRGERILPLQLLTYTLIPLSVGMFPHMFIHWLTARSATSFRPTIALYPLCIAVVWAPSVLLGVLARADFPDLGAAAAGSVLVKVVDLHSPGILSGLLAACVLGAIMNSFDSQVHALGTMFTQDVVRHYGFHDRMSERSQLLAGRCFVVGILVATYFLSRFANPSLFKLGVWCFTGFAALFPIVAAALYWRRSTRWGAFASTLSALLLWLYFVRRGWRDPDYTLGGTGVMPVAAILLVSTAAMIAGSLLTRPPEPATLDKFFPREAA